MSKKNQPSPERRSSARLVDSLDFKLGFDGYDLSTNTLNISKTGLLCRVAKPLSPMTRVQMALMIPANTKNQSKVISFDGVVVRCDKKDDSYDVAIFFTEMSEVDRQVLEDYINNRMNDSN